MAEYFSVDRTENGLAILVGDSGEKLEVPVSELVPPAREGMVYRSEGGKFVRDEGEEKARRKRIFDLQKKLFKK